MDTVLREHKLIISIYDYYKKHNRTSYIHVETLLILHRLGYNCISVIWILYLNSFTKKALSITKKFGCSDYKDDIIQEWYFKFVERVEIYDIPCKAPFTGFINGYAYKWMTAYVNLEKKRRIKYYESNIDDRG